MGGIYYNEWDEPTAIWLRELGAGHHLPSGHIDTRSIRDVQPDDVVGYDQCHFFAGIGGWPLALRWAGLENVPGIWTGSPPCQPFSVAGKGLAQSDERHLAPVWLDLVRECKPVLLLGEQVADAIGKGWLDDLFDALEREGYACGAAVLPACSVGAPHIRKRLFFGAVRLADANGWSTGDKEEQRCGEHRLFAQGGSDVREGREGARPESDGMANSNEGQCRGLANSEGCKPHGSPTGRVQGNGIAQSGGIVRRLADTNDTRPQGRTGMSERADEQPPGSGSLESGSTDSHHGGWADADWLGCRDGKFRPVEPGTQPLAHGLPKGMVRGSVRSLAEYPSAARVMRIRGYGNAIVPEVAATFITEFLNAFADVTKNH